MLGVAQLSLRYQHVVSAEFFVFLSYQHVVLSLVLGLGVHVGLLCLQSVGEAQHNLTID